MNIRKIDLDEIINSSGDLIGSSNIPANGSDLESAANNTTDYNSKIGTQPFRYDMLGRFGFTLLPFFEGKDNQEQIELIQDLAELMYSKYMETLEYYYKHPNKLKPDYRQQSNSDFNSQPEDKKNIDFDWAKKVLNVIQPYIEKSMKKPENIDESKLFEDFVVGEKEEIEMSEKKSDMDIRDKKIEKIAGLINKLDKKDINKLINLLEKEID